MTRKVVYAGSFDPATNGHLWMITQVSSLFDEVVVAIGQNIEKKCKFSVEEREGFLRGITSGLKNITITNYKNEFLVSYAKRIGASYIARGIRNSNDYEYERSMRYINSDLSRDIQTIFLMPPRDYAEVSSSMVMGLVGSDGWENIVKKYVPQSVFEGLLNSYTKNSKICD